MTHWHVHRRLVVECVTNSVGLYCCCCCRGADEAYAPDAPPLFVVASLPQPADSGPVNVGSSPSLHPSGRLLHACAGNSVVTLLDVNTDDCTQVWLGAIIPDDGPGDHFIGTPTISPDGTIAYLLSEFYASPIAERQTSVLAVVLDSGALLWVCRLLGGATSPSATAALTADARMLYVTSLAAVYAVSGSDGSVVWSRVEGASHASPAIRTAEVDGVLTELVYVTTGAAKTVLCLRGDTGVTVRKNSGRLYACHNCMKKMHSNVSETLSRRCR